MDFRVGDGIFGGARDTTAPTGFSLLSTGLSGVRSTDERFEAAEILYMPDCVPAYDGNFRIGAPHRKSGWADCKENGARESCGPMPAVRKSLRTVWVRTDRELSAHAVPVSFPFVRGRFEAGFSGRFEIGGVRAHSRRGEPAADVRFAKARLFDPRKAGRASAEDDAGGGGCRFRALSFRRRRGRGLRSC